MAYARGGVVRDFLAASQLPTGANNSLSVGRFGM